jgi:hypothetical protein
MSDEKKEDFEFQELTDYRKLAIEGMTYSIQRIDILIIALCTSGIFLDVTEMLKKPDSVALKVSLSLYVGSIVVNLISQFFGYYANRKLVQVYDRKVLDYKSDPKSFDDKNYEEDENSAHGYGDYVQGLNISSFVFLVLGMIGCLWYYLSI